MSLARIGITNEKANTGRLFPELPYSAIDDAGARMYKGEWLDTRPVNGDDLATSEAGRFDSEPGALVDSHD